MMSAILATSRLFKIMLLWNKGFDAIIPVDDVTKKNYHVVQIIF